MFNDVSRREYSGSNWEYEDEDEMKKWGWDFGGSRSKYSQVVWSHGEDGRGKTRQKNLQQGG